MRLFAALLTCASLLGCGSFGNSVTENHSTLEMKKACGCPGMKECCKGLEGHACCTPDDCTCNQITKRNDNCSCCQAR